MPARRITCIRDGCGRLVRRATPILGHHAVISFDTKSYCSNACADLGLIDAITCCNHDCYRMIAHELCPSTIKPQRFDMQKYCSIACARQHYRYAPLDTSAPFSTCDVCADDKPLTPFVHTARPRTINDWGYPVTRPDIPPHRRRHIMPELRHFESGVCVECISEFLTTQFKMRGARGIVCISDTCAPHLYDDAQYTNWLSRAASFLPDTLLSEFFQDSFNLWLSHHTQWQCPSGCAIGDYIFDPVNMPTYPQIHCPGCKQPFYAQGQVLWHEKSSCQQHRAANPVLRDEAEVQPLAEMTKIGARRCPCCQSIIIKDGGCDHMVCESCDSGFSWMMAERVVPVGGFETDDERAYEKEPSDADNQDVNNYGLFHVPEVACEMDGIAARADAAKPTHRLSYAETVRR